jgi:hypothetical protein
VLIVLALVSSALFALPSAALPSAALAAPAQTFAGLGEGAGQLNAPFGVAVDSSTGAPTSGDVYVADRNNHRIDVFDPAGHFLLAFGFGVADGTSEALQTCGPAASPPTSVCRQGLNQGLAGTAPGQLLSPDSLAVDPASHDLYVSDGEASRVQVFSPGGEFILMFGSEVDHTTHADVCTKEDIEVKHDTCGAGAVGSGPGAFQTFFPLPLAFDAVGHLWVGDLYRLEQFSPQGAFISQLSLPAGDPVQALAIDTSFSLSSGDFYVITPSTSEVQEFTPPTSGTYTLSFEGQTTESLPFDAPGSCPSEKQCGPTDQASLEALSSIGPGNVYATSATFAPGNAPRTIGFGGALSNTAVSQIVPSAGTVVTVTQGVRGQLLKFGPAGQPLATLDPGGHPEALGLDPATGDVFVSDQPQGGASLLVFDPSGAQTAAFGFGEVIGQPYANALAFGAQAQRVYAIGSAAQIFTPPPPGPLVEHSTSEATEIHKTAATLRARVNPEGAATTYHFQYLTEKQYQEDGEEFGAGSVNTPESISIGADFTDHTASLAIPAGQLSPGTAYRFRIVAGNENAPPGGVDGEAVGFQTLPAAAIDSTSVSAVTASSATLEAQIDPLGDATSYEFQFLTEAEYQANLAGAQDPFAGAAQAPLQAAPIGSGSADVLVSQHLQGLLAQTAYRYRVLATNHCNPVQLAETCQSAGGARVFTTQGPASSAVLPDNRGWELVSPPDKRGALIEPISVGHVTQAAAGGAAFTYLANAPTEAVPAGSEPATQILSSRGSAGWSSRDLIPSHQHATGVENGLGDFGEYRYFSTDLSQAIVHPFGSFEPALSPQGSEQTAYLHANFPSATPTAFCGASCYTPLLAGCPAAAREECPPVVAAAADVPPGTSFGEGPGGGCEFGAICGPPIEGASPDLAHVVLKSAVGLTAAPGDHGGLYEWSALAPPSERLRPVSVLPGGAQVAAGLGSGGHTTRNAISSDGSRVFFTASVGQVSHLYLRYNATAQQSAVNGSGQCTEPAKACTIQLDAVQGGTGAVAATGAEFQLASADGSRAFFLDEQQLTADSGANGGNFDLYECQIVVDAGGHLACDLTDLTPLSSGLQPAQVRRMVIGASEDGSSLYFVAGGVLAGNKVENGGGVEAARPGNCGNNFDEPLGATCNLYRVHQGALTFIATLSPADPLAWGGASEYRLSDTASRVSPNGRFLAFMSTRPLTGYDNRDARTGARDLEVFLYDARTEKLVCASCNPTGARPHGAEFGALTSELDGGITLPSQTGVAASLPSWITGAYGSTSYQSRFLSDAGRLFFNASDALVPSDTNGVNDVYQYEPPRSAVEAPPNDTCTVASSTYSPFSQGCVDLISSGTSPTDSGFLDASESGEDVFFFTNSKLAPADIDTARDVYDARVNGGEAQPGKPVECEGDACQSPVAAPEDPTPGSLTFQGPGNLPQPVVASVKGKAKPLTRAQKLVRALKACSRRPKRKRSACERQARRAYAPAGKAKKSNRRTK